ncbi:MAG: hypothetical protein MJY94_04935 [Bacteroidales bacterium]|nr:hypothetical protein [Bacteroidales bacterium]
MKKIIIAIALMAVSAFSANAQKISMSAEAFGGKGLEFVNINGGANFVVGYEFNDAFSFGVGVGGRYNDGHFRHLTKTITEMSGQGKTTESSLNHKEILVPVFARAKYIFTGIDMSNTGRLQPYVAIDGGYSVNVLAMAPSADWEGSVNTNAGGLFYAPQLGLDSDRMYLSVGLEMQAVKQVEDITKISINIDDVENVMRQVQTFNNFSQTVVVRVGLKF